MVQKNERCNVKMRLFSFMTNWIGIVRDGRGPGVSAPAGVSKVDRQSSKA